MPSQNDEDAILADLLARIGHQGAGYFVEIGTGADASECNTRALHEQGWQGWWIDREGRPPVHREHVTSRSINGLLRALGVPQSFDVLSIDVDGQDLWLWEALIPRPSIVVVEYNSSLGAEASLSVAPNDAWLWDGGTWTFGASLLALARLGHYKGYTLAHTNGVNAFFVRLDHWVRVCYRPLAVGAFGPARADEFVLAP